MQKNPPPPPHGLHSDFPRVFVFAANSIRQSPIRTKVDGGALGRPPHLKPAATAELQDIAKSLSVCLNSNPKLDSTAFRRLELRFPALDYYDIGNHFPHSRAYAIFIPKSDWLKDKRPAALVNFLDELEISTRWGACDSVSLSGPVDFWFRPLFAPR